jgi:hypothetical protein
MRDPHVVSLLYRLETGPSLRFDNPPPRDYETNEFNFRLADGVVTCTMKAHYASPNQARAVVEPVLRAWELDTALRHGKRELWFTYENVEVIDRDPPPEGHVLMVAAAGEINLAGDVSLLLTRHEYPAPPTRFTASPDVETLWHRYEGYKQGRELLLGMAYACLTFLEAQVRGRVNAAKTYAIDVAILRKLGDLTTNLGDERTARKFHMQSARRPPTPQEAAWIDAAIRMIIRRVAEHAADPTANWPKLSMSDLPPL